MARLLGSSGAIRLVQVCDRSWVHGHHLVDLGF